LFNGKKNKNKKPLNIINLIAKIKLKEIIFLFLFFVLVYIHEFYFIAFVLLYICIYIYIYIYKKTIKKITIIKTNYKNQNIGKLQKLQMDFL